MTITAPAPLARISAPLPVPRRFTLLDAASVITDSNDRALSGAYIEAYPSGQADLHDPCSDGSARVKALNASFANPAMFGFTAYLKATCDTVGVASRVTEFRQRLQRQFRVVESAAVERFLAGGGGLGLGAYLGDTNLDILGGGAVSPTEGLALLENAIAEVGNGMIHATPATVTAWAGKYLVEEARDGQMRTRLGTLVAVGAGYIGADPASGTSPSGDQEWAFASTFVELRRGDDEIIPVGIGQAMDRSTNDVTFIAERNYLVSWVGRQDGSDSDHIQAGVLVDRSA